MTAVLPATVAVPSRVPAGMASPSPRASDPYWDRSGSALRDDLADVAVRPQRAPRPDGARGRHLAPVAPARPRRSPVVPALVAAGIVLVALFALAAMHALLISGQFRLDGLRQDASSETEKIRRLELRVAQLEAPDRVLGAARDRLGMVEPDQVGYLPPVGVPVEDATPVRVAPAAAPTTTVAAVASAPDAAPADAAPATSGPADAPADATATPSEGPRDE